MTKPTKGEIKLFLVSMLHKISGEIIEVSKFTEKTHLTKNLLLTMTMVKALAKTYTTYSKKHGGKSITMKEASKTLTLGALVKLLNKRINGREGNNE